jgi:type 1 glutamine amidotransferase
MLESRSATPVASAPSFLPSSPDPQRHVEDRDHPCDQPGHDRDRFETFHAVPSDARVGRKFSARARKLQRMRAWRASAALGLVVFVCGAVAQPAAASSPPAFRALVFSKTAGYRHDSIPAAISAIEQLGAANGFAVDATEDASTFTSASLSRYRVVIFLLTTGDVLDAAQQAAFTTYIEAGGAFVGVHSAADTEHDWPWYGGLVGAYFASHPPVQRATVDVVDRNTPSTVHLSAVWGRTDEWYNFSTDPSASVTVLARLDERTYAPGDGAMGASHPIAWQHRYDGGRSWYTGGGHTIASYSEPMFRRHLLGGILWAAGYGLPKLESIHAQVAGARLKIVATHPDCYRCTLQLRVQDKNRAETITVDARGRRTEALTRALHPGLRRYSVILSGGPLAVHVTAHRSVTIP